MAVLSGRGVESEGAGAAGALASDAVHGVTSTDYGRVLASVIGTVGDWTIAEDAVQDALVRALDRWQRDGVPRNPAAWVMTVARRRAIDLLRHESAERRALARLEHELLGGAHEPTSGVAFPAATNASSSSSPHATPRSASKRVRR